MCVKRTTAVIVNDSLSRCDAGWSGHEDSALCYKYQSSAENFAMAKILCAESPLQGKLAMPDDDFQHHFTQATANSGGLYWIGLFLNGTWWTGDRANITNRLNEGPYYGSYGAGASGYSVASGYPTDDEMCIAVNVSGGMGREWVAMRCNTKLPYVCEKKANNIAAPEFLLNPIDLIVPSITSNVPRRRKRQATCEYKLTCIAENHYTQTPDAVVWVKDGVYMRSPQGATMCFYPNEKNEVSVPGLLNNNDFQGYYHCEVWGQAPKFERVASGRALVTFEGVATFRANYSPSASHRDAKTLVTDSVIQMSYDGPWQWLYDAMFGNYNNLQVTMVSYVPDVSRDFAGRPNSSICIHAIFRIYFIYPVRNDAAWRSVREYLAKPDVMIDHQNETVESYINEKFYSILANTSTFYSGSPIDLRRTDGCQAKVYRPMIESDFQIQLSSTRFNHTALSDDLCPADREPLVVAECMGDFVEGGYWDFRHPECSTPPGPISDVTLDLQALAEVAVSESNVEEVSELIANLTSNASVLVYIDIIYSAVILNNIAAVQNSKSSVAEQFLTTVDNLANTRTMVLREAQTYSNAPSRIITAMERLCGNVVLEHGHSSLSLHRPNLAVEVVDYTERNPIIGVTSSDKNLSKVYTFESPRGYNISEMEATIVLPMEAIELGEMLQEFLHSTLAINRPLRISFSIFRNNALFPKIIPAPGAAVKKETRSNSLIISATVNGLTIVDLKDPVTMVLKLADPNLTSLPHNCSYWNYDLESRRWSWSTHGLGRTSNGSKPIDRGVSLAAGSDAELMRLICYSNHLTNFAVIAGFTGYDPVLMAISIIGLILSIVGLSLTILSHIIFRLWKDVRKGRSQLVLLHLSVALLAVDILVLAGVDRTENRTGCKAVAALLHYFLLVSFSWMLVEGVLQYLKFVKVFDIYTPRFMLKTALPAWIVPGVIVIIIAIINTELFRGPERYCWISADIFHFAFLLPLGLVMVTNLVLFILVIKGITCDRADVRSTQKKEELMKFQVLVAVCSFIVMGLTWLFALLAIDSSTPFTLAMQYLFCIFNSIQGFLIFLFLNIREKTVRDGWKKLFNKLCHNCRVMREKSVGARRPGAAVLGLSTPGSDKYFTVKSLYTGSEGSKSFDSTESTKSTSEASSGPPSPVDVPRVKKGASRMLPLNEEMCFKNQSFRGSTSSS
jgi:hypothetical protein